LEGIFPENAKRRTTENLIVIKLVLKDDPERPNKRSKTIKIEFSEEFVEDYFETKTPSKIEIDEKVKNHIKKQLSGFDPNHNASRLSNPPCVVWKISSKRFFLNQY
jgi:hypothetical protein